MIPPGDNEAAVRFLRWARPGGPWVLTAIDPHSRDAPTETRTFDESKTAGLVEFLVRNNGVRNLYWATNPTRGALTKKASKEDVEAMAFLHIDLDPAKGGDLQAERVGILARLQAFRPVPTIIVDSGGGYQGFWRLREPIHIGGDLSRAADAEAYNQQLEILLRGDACHNCDRVMRLPGTVNIPDEKKRRAGRTPRLAQVVGEAGPDYDLADFTAAPRVQARSGSSAPARGVQLSGNLPSILVDDLPERVTMRTKMLIVQGEDPDDPTKYASRSQVVFAVCCQMIRAGCDDDTIAAILLDKDYAVSAHNLAQRRPVDYVARQIQRAREECEEPMLRVLNEKHAVIEDYGGKCRVISEVEDLSMERPRTKISKQSFDDFRNRYMHIKVEVGKAKEGATVYKPAGAWWLGHPMRRQYTTIVFAPGRDLPDAYNLWQGFACEAIPGQKHQSFLEHVRLNLCGGNEEHYTYLICWMARAVQYPGRQGEVAVVLRGGRGTGKGTYAHLFGDLWGRHYMQVTTAKHLVGNFNAHLRDCVFLFADEAFFAGDKQHESVLKTLVTEPTLVIEGKGIDVEVSANCTHLVMSSNSEWVVPAGSDERRFFVLEVGDGAKQDTAYFARMRKDFSDGGRESLLHYLMTLDLSNYDVRRVPQTVALQDQKLYSMSLEEQWWLERLMDGRLTAVKEGWDGVVLKDALQGDYLRYAEAQRINRRSSPTAMGKFLSRVMPGVYPISKQLTADVEKVDGDGRVYEVRERAYHYEVPALSACREKWTELYGETEWPSEEAVSRAPQYFDAQNREPY